MAIDKRKKTVRVCSYQRTRNGNKEHVRKHLRRPPL